MHVSRSIFIMTGVVKTERGCCMGPKCARVLESIYNESLSSLGSSWELDIPASERFVDGHRTTSEA